MRSVTWLFHTGGSRLYSRQGPVVAAAYIWIALGLFSFGYLCWTYGATVFEDLKSGSLCDLLPLALGIPLCFFNLDSFGMLNTESLSQLQHALEEVQKPDLGYTGVFWVSYPSRSLLLNLIPTFLTGLSPWAYRVGFSFPTLFGALFFSPACDATTETTASPLLLPPSSQLRSSPTQPSAQSLEHSKWRSLR